MFTGIIEEIGTVRGLRRAAAGYELSIGCRTVLEGTRLGDSIAVEGVCLTVTHLHGDGFTVGLSPETRSRTGLAALQSGAPVNLERSVTPTTRMGGHFVQGHVDGPGTIVERRRDEDALWIVVQAPSSLLRYVVPKGYVALDGASLTVVDADDERFSVQLVAYTQRYITLPGKSVGAAINIEVDVLGKYVEKLLSGRGASGRGGAITMDFLAENGYA
jgi:riboflavin synthase